jgi:prepilin-type N-terminal cleavage/methylation domain-containing protein
MRQAPQFPRADRRGFTMVELLVVMTILLVLMSLSLSAVQRVRSKARELKVRNDISQLSASIQAFKSNKQVAYVPSRIRLRNNLAAYSTPVDQLDIDSFAYLKKVWPRLSAVYDQTNANSNMRSFGWFPNDPNAALTSAYVLEGWQTMVFFLGGIQSGNATLGFSTNPSNPTLLAFRMEQPYFDFPTDRLQPGTNVAGITTLGFQDPYGTFYAYFSTTYGNDYNRYSSQDNTSDCVSLSVAPYYDVFTNASGNVAVYYNRDSFQIISAGKDTTFGIGSSLMYGNTWAGTQWSAGIGWASGTGADDFSNFSQYALGIGTNAP